MGLQRRKQLWLAASFLLALLLIVSRRFDAVTRAQFFAEDGPAWYAQAYSLGPWHALVLPFAGYLQVLPRLAAAFALLFPLLRAPLVMNVIGLLVQALPIPILLSSRLDHWASRPARLLMAATYIALPNAAELHASVTQGQWHLALAACLLVLATPPVTRLRIALDGALLLTCGLSGPFVIPLSIVAFAYWRLRRGNWRAGVTVALVFFAVLQAGCLLLSGSRPEGTVGPSLNLLLQTLAAQIYEGSLIGRNSMHRKNALILIVVCLLGTSVVVYCFGKTRWEWRLLILFLVAVFAASLANPNAGKGPSQWAAMAGSWDNRYWFFGMLAFIWSLVWISVQSRALPWRIPAIGALSLMLVYLPKTWLIKPADDVGFSDAVRRFERAAAGETVTIPVLPVGWTMNLRKH